MKKWILIAVLTIALVVAVMLASRNTPIISDTPSDDFGTEESSGTEESTGAGDSSDTNIESTLSYEEYQAMSGPERQSHLETFSDLDAFLAWLNHAKAEYEAHQATRPTIDGNGTIDISGLVGNNE